jgi:CRP-like cAMP-binding protein
VHASGKHSVKLKVTQSELASMLGVSRESVNKQLNTLAKGGSIALGRGSITVKDAKTLHAAE